MTESSTEHFAAAIEALESDRFFGENVNWSGGERVPGSTGKSLGSIMLLGESGRRRFDRYTLWEDDLQHCYTAAEIIDSEIESLAAQQPLLIDYQAARTIHPNAQVMFTDNVQKVEYAGFTSSKQNRQFHEFLHVPANLKDIIELNAYMKSLRNERFRQSSETEKPHKFEKPDDFATLHAAIGIYQRIVAVNLPNGQYL